MRKAYYLNGSLPICWGPQLAWDDAVFGVLKEM